MSFHNSGENTIWSKLKTSKSSLQTQLHNLNINSSESTHHTNDMSTQTVKTTFKSKLNIGSTSSRKHKKHTYFVEQDGDSIETTVVHKSIIKYYKNLKKEHPEKFNGYPSWLGYVDKDEDEVKEKEIIPENTESSAKTDVVEDIPERPRIYRPISSTNDQLRSGYKPLSSRLIKSSSFHSVPSTSNFNTMLKGSSEPPLDQQQSPKPTLRASSSMRYRMKRR